MRCGKFAQTPRALSQLCQHPHLPHRWRIVITVLTLTHSAGYRAHQAGDGIEQQYGAFVSGRSHFCASYNNQMMQLYTCFHRVSNPGQGERNEARDEQPSARSDGQEVRGRQGEGTYES